MKYKLVIDIEINSVEDLKELRTIVEANNSNKPNFSKISRNLEINRRTLKKYYIDDYRKEKKNISTYFIKCHNLIVQIKKAYLEHKFEARIKCFVKYKLLIVVMRKTLL